MNDIQKLTTPAQIVRSTTYERSQNVQVTSSVRREGDVRSETTVRTTINELKETITTREELENLARRKNRRTDVRERSTAMVEDTSARAAATTVDIPVPVSPEPPKDYLASLTNTPQRRSGRLFNVVV